MCITIHHKYTGSLVLSMTDAVDLSRRRMVAEQQGEQGELIDDGDNEEGEEGEEGQGDADLKEMNAVATLGHNEFNEQMMMM